MKRVDIQYDGEHYSIGGRDIDDVKREIADGMDSGSTFWLEVNSGEGRMRAASLALTPGVAIAVMSADEE
jgi:hypothetical protein